MGVVPVSRGEAGTTKKSRHPDKITRSIFKPLISQGFFYILYRLQGKILLALTPFWLRVMSFGDDKE